MRPNEILASRYKIVRSIGITGARQKYVGQDLQNGELIDIEVISHSDIKDEAQLRAIKYEIDLAKKLQGPYFATFIDSFTHQNDLVIIWKYIDGQTLSNNDSLEELTARDVCNFISLTVKAVNIAHQNGIIHGSLSSDVILITPQLEPVIIGFSVPGGEPITDPGTLRGVSAYACAAPELFRGEPIEESCDFYAIGKIAEFLFSLVKTRESPHRKRNTSALITTEIDDAKALIGGLVSTERSFRIQSALRIGDDSFLDLLATPIGGNPVIRVSRRQSRQIKKRLHQPKPLRTEKTSMLISVGVKALIIACVAISLIVIIANFIPSK